MSACRIDIVKLLLEHGECGLEPHHLGHIRLHGILQCPGMFLRGGELALQPHDRELACRKRLANDRSCSDRNRGVEWRGIRHASWSRASSGVVTNGEVLLSLAFLAERGESTLTVDTSFLLSIKASSSASWSRAASASLVVTCGRGRREGCRLRPPGALTP